jgi:serine/threonine protein kinase
VHEHCLDENTVIELAQGRLPGHARAEIDRHVDGCEACREMLAVVATLLVPARGEGAAALGEPSRPDAFAGEPTHSAHLTGPALEAGDRVAARFEVLRLLGSGGFGMVYLARDLDLGRHVAIKVMRTRTGAVLSPDEEKRFEKEARATARLNHPNIVTVHDFGSWRGQPYLVLEWLRGEALAQRLRRGPLTVVEAVGIGVQVARALAHAHAGGVLHLDLKPSNIFVGDDGHVKVLDFGLAQIDLTRTTAPDGRGHDSRTFGASSPSGGTPRTWRPSSGAEMRSTHARTSGRSA